MASAEFVPLIDQLLKDYMAPAILDAATSISEFSNMIAKREFGHPWAEIDPDFWRWKRLMEPLCESDQCPFIGEDLRG